ncbi:MAG: FG-GAP-like repeat-containing protein [Acidobacteriota bacterium]
MDIRVFSKSLLMVLVFSFTVVLICGVIKPSSASASLTFTEIGASAGITEPTDANGSSVADFDSDGLEDLILVGYLPSVTGNTLKLFHNNGDGTFNDVTDLWVDLSSVQAQDVRFSTWGDFDNDGDLDAVLGTSNPAKLIFYRNNQVGSGSPILSVMQTISEPINLFYLASWADYDNDGDLDLLANRFPGTLLLLKNHLKETGTPLFTDVSIVAGIDQNAITASSLHWSDVDNDGDVDLYVINDKNYTSYHNFYRNLLIPTGNAVLQDETVAVGLPRSLYQATHAQFADYDDDGDMDIYFNLGFFTANLLYKNNFVETGVLSFTEQPNALGATSPIDGGYEIVWSDYDNDGDIDLLNGGGSNDPSFLYQNLLVENTVPGFADITTTAGLSGQSHRNSMFAFDLENDGDRDIFMGYNGIGANRLYRNNLTDSHWLSLNLVGTTSNHDGIGARIMLRTGTHRQYRQHNIPGSWTTGIQSHRLHFGLDSANIIDEIEIRWTSGCTQTLTNVAANQILTVVENCNDTQPPSIVCPANLVTTAASGESSLAVTYPPPTANDNAGIPTVVCSPSSGSTFPLGITTVTCTATDGANNQTSCTFKIVISGTLLAVADNFLRDGADNTNEGANERLRIQSSGHNRVIVRFNLSGISTDGLQSANLILNIAENSDNWGTTGRLVDAHRLLADWTEGNGRNDVMVGGGQGFRGTGEGATWKCAKDSNINNQNDDCVSPWNGGSFASATASSILHINNQMGDVSWNVLADMQAGADYGWLIKKQAEGQNGQVRYYSREGATLAGNANLAPRLVLIYQP